MAGHPCLILRATSLSLQGDPANIGKGSSRPARCTRGPGDRFGSRNLERARRRSGPSCVLPQGVQQGQTESGGIVLAAICWAPSAQRRCHPEEALYLPTFSHLLIVNKVFSLSLSLSLSLIPWGEMVFRMFDVAPPLLQPTFNPCLVPKKLPSIEFLPIKKNPLVRS